MTEQAFVYDGPNVLFVFTTRDGVTTARRWLNAYGLDKRYGFEDYAGAAPTPGTGAVYEVHQDYRGSVVAAVDPVSRTVVSEYAYDSFGRRTKLREGVEPGYGFTGQQVDAETGLGYFRMRYYDPGEGIFLSADPMGFPDGNRNAYKYVANTPYQSVDPFGLSALPLTIKTKDATSNDIYAQGITGAATGQLIRMFGEVEEFLASLKGFQGSVEGAQIGGSLGRGVTPSLLLARCWPLNSRDKFKIIPGDDKRKHGGPAHQALIAARIAELASGNAIRMLKIGIRPDTLVVNRRQFNSARQVVSNCKPDIQYDYFAGGAHMIEEVSVTSPIFLEVAKAIQMLRADPMSGYLLWRRYKR